jgi:hypothetical protein
MWQAHSYGVCHCITLHPPGDPCDTIALFVSLLYLHHQVLLVMTPLSSWLRGWQLWRSSWPGGAPAVAASRRLQVRLLNQGNMQTCCLCWNIQCLGCIC